MLASKVLLWYNAKVMAEKVYDTGEYTPSSSSSINALLDEVNRERTMRQEIDDIAREIREIENSIARLKTIRCGLKSTHEMNGIDQTIDRLTAKRAGLVQKQKAGQLKLQQTRDIGQKRLGRRVGKRLEQEIRNIHKQGHEYSGDTLVEVAAAGLAAHVYDVIISDDPDNQPQERNNHDS